MIGYKGFDKDLQCRGMQYEVGATYIMYDSPVLCSRGYHFCQTLKDVFNHYSNYGDNKFAIIEYAGKFEHGKDKSVTNEIKIVKILSPQEIEDILEEERLKTVGDDVYALGIVRALQEEYNIYVGGSIGLFLHGYDLKRKQNQVDLDLVMPFYQKIKEKGKITNAYDLDVKTTSGSDFQDTMTIAIQGKHIKADICIDPKLKYEEVEYRGFTYKVVPLFVILQAKMKYAANGQQKHIQDFVNLMKRRKDFASGITKDDEV